MVRMDVVLALVGLVVWVGTYLLYFRPVIQRWIKQRPVKRAQAREAAEKAAVEMQRLRDELASKYLPPGTGKS